MNHHETHSQDMILTVALKTANDSVVLFQERFPLVIYF